MTTEPQTKFAFNYALALFLTALVLMCFGLVMVYASSSTVIRKSKSKAKVELTAATPLSESFMRSHSTTCLQKQAMWAVTGLVVIFFFAHLKYSNLRFTARGALSITVGLLIAVLFSAAINGSRRWLRLGPISIQPSEFAKLALVVAMAAYLTHRADCLTCIKRCLLGALTMLGIVTALVLKEPDFGSAAVIAMIIFAMWCVAGLRKWHLMTVASVGVTAGALLIACSPYRLRRFLAFWDPEKYILTGGWQPLQSLIALGSGGEHGLGLGQSMQKFLFLTEAHTDFIFSIIGEELGLAGATGVLAVYLVLILLALRVTWQTPDTFGFLLAFGLTAMIAIPATVNIGVVTSSLPTKGLALPFISYGGSSLLVNCMAIGILMNIASANYAQRRTA